MFYKHIWIYLVIFLSEFVITPVHSSQRRGEGRKRSGSELSDVSDGSGFTSSGSLTPISYSGSGSCSSSSRRHTPSPSQSPLTPLSPGSARRHLTTKHLQRIRASRSSPSELSYAQLLSPLPRSQMPELDEAARKGLLTATWMAAKTIPGRSPRLWRQDSRGYVMCEPSFNQSPWLKLWVYGSTNTPTHALFSPEKRVVSRADVIEENRIKSRVLKCGTDNPQSIKQRLDAIELAINGYIEGEDSKPVCWTPSQFYRDLDDPEVVSFYHHMNGDFTHGKLGHSNLFDPLGISLKPLRTRTLYISNLLNLPKCADYVVTSSPVASKPVRAVQKMPAISEDVKAPSPVPVSETADIHVPIAVPSTPVVEHPVTGFITSPPSKAVRPSPQKTPRGTHSAKRQAIQSPEGTPTRRRAFIGEGEDADDEQPSGLAAVNRGLAFTPDQRQSVNLNSSSTPVAAPNNDLASVVTRLEFGESKTTPKKSVKDQVNGGTGPHGVTPSKILASTLGNMALSSPGQAAYPSIPGTSQRAISANQGYGQPYMVNPPMAYQTPHTGQFMYGPPPPLYPTSQFVQYPQATMFHPHPYPGPHAHSRNPFSGQHVIRPEFAFAMPPPQFGGYQSGPHPTEYQYQPYQTYQEPLYGLYDIPHGYQGPGIMYHPSESFNHVPQPSAHYQQGSRGFSPNYDSSRRQYQK